MKDKGKGCIFSPEDDRDYTIKKARTKAKVIALQPKIELPEEYRTIDDTPILDQGIYPTCVSYALVAALMHAEYKQGAEYATPYSRGFIYANREEDQHQGDGMIVREALQQLTKYGDCEYNLFPFNRKYKRIRNKFKKQEDTLKQNAQPYIISSYFRCRNEQEIKEAIMTYGSVIMGIDTFSGFKGKNIPVPDEDEAPKGGHCMCCVGWNKEGWIVQNSWGKSFGEDGYCYIPYEYPEAEWWGIIINPNFPRYSKPDKRTQKIYKIINFFRDLFFI